MDPFRTYRNSSDTHTSDTSNESYPSEMDTPDLGMGDHPGGPPEYTGTNNGMGNNGTRISQNVGEIPL